ncbi:MAG: hypothetical protein ABH878_02980, partial [bacterium]
MRSVVYRFCAALLLLTICTLPLLAKTNPQGNAVGPVRGIAGEAANDKYMILDVSNIWSAISNFGNYGDPNAALPSGQWPGGSGNNYIWEGRFWLGALVQGKKRISHADYGDYEFHSANTDPVDPFFLGSGKSIQDARVIYDDYATTTTHFPLGLKVIQSALTWSMPEYDDFIILEYKILNNGSIGTLSNFYAAWIFDNDVATLDASEPHIDDNVDYDGWDGADSNTDEVDWVDPLDLDGDDIDGYDDWGIPYGWSGGLPLGSGDNPNYNAALIEPDGVFDEYQIYLDDNGPVIYGQAGAMAGQPLTDAEGDVLHGWLISRNMSIIYDGDNNAVQGNDTGERGMSTPCDGWTGGRLIYTPRAAFNSTLDDTLPRPFAHQWWNWNSDPGNDDEKYEYMSASHSAGMGYHFIPNPREIGAPTFDYRWLTSTGPFSFPPGDTLRVVYAFCLGQGLKGVRAAADQAMVAYYAGSSGNPANPTDLDNDNHYVLPVPPPIPNLNYTGIAGGVRLAWDEHAEFQSDPLLGYSDFEGYKIYRAPYAPTGWQLISACDLLPDSAVFVVSVEGDTLNPFDPTADAYVPVDLPDIVHAFEDVGGQVLRLAEIDSYLVVQGYDPDDLIWTTYDQPVNNVPYYYTVVAYDSYKPAT